MRGFTLIEVIVVIAIIGALAAILIPTMIGYMKDSHISTANTNAKLAYTTAAAYATTCSANGYAFSTELSRADLSWQGDSAPAYSPCENGADVLNALKAGMGGKNSGGFVTMKVNSSTAMPAEVWWASTTLSTYVGHYPDEYSDKTEGGLPA